MITRVLVFILLQQIGQLYCDIVIPHVPCPKVFEYVYDGNEWVGLITVPAPNVHEVVMQVNFSIPDINLPNYGEIHLLNKDTVLDDIKHRRLLHYKVSLPNSKYVAQVTEINYNGDILCSGRSVSPPSSSFWLQHTLNWSGSISNSAPYYPPKAPVKKPFPSAPINAIQPTTPKPSLYKNKYANSKDCGTIRKKRSAGKSDTVPLIYFGTPVGKNDHPWLAAMYDIQTGPLVFFCGGNLISNKHVLTAAHCTINKKKVQVKVGAHNTKQVFDLGAILRNVISIKSHDEYAAGSAHADISIVTLSATVEFTATIKPICLWNFEEDFDSVVGVTGTIMGWGLTEQGDVSSLPLQTTVTVAPQHQCEQVELLQNAISDTTFCAGTKGTGPCMGDSGGGLFIQRDGKWFIRGIISTSLADRRQVCDVNTFSVYVDTAKYMDWITDNMI